MFLAMLISIVRYILTLKSAKNSQVSRAKVTGWTLALFVFFSIISFTWWVIYIIFDIPYSILVENCFSKTREPRALTFTARVVLNYHYIFSLVSLTVDVLLVQFLKKTISPTSGQALSTISGILVNSFFLHFSNLN